MGFFSRIGAKVAGALSSGSRLGQKALGNVARVGHKIADVKLLEVLRESLY